LLSGLTIGELTVHPAFPPSSTRVKCSRRSKPASSLTFWITYLRTTATPYGYSLGSNAFAPQQPMGNLTRVLGRSTALQV
jgi:hypothetical protein